jgi:hypothetical protein
VSLEMSFASGPSLAMSSVANRPAPGLQQQRGQQHDDRQRAERIVAWRVHAAAHELQDRARTAQEVREARVVIAGEPPQDAEQQQRENRVARVEVPLQPRTAQLGGDEREDHQRREHPVEQAGGQIPDAHGTHLGGAAKGR